MPSSEVRSTWRGLAKKAEAVCEAARHDPYDPRLVEDMQALAGDLAASNAGHSVGSTTLQPDEREQRAATHAAAGEAWFALLDSKQALAGFDTALELLGDDGARSPACAAAQAQALCGRGKCLVDLQRSAEAIPVLQASIDWYIAQGDPSDEAQESLLSQALHTLGLAHADAGDHENALDATARAVALRRRLAERDVGRYGLALSRSLRNLGIWLNELGRRDEALRSRREMLELRREQHHQQPSVVATLALAQGADTLARELVESGRELDGALALAQDSAALYLELDRRYPERFAAAFERQVEYLIALTGGLVNAGILEPAMLMAEAALHFLRQSSIRSDRVAPALGQTMGQLSLALRGQGLRAEALRAAEEALGLYRALARANPQAFAPDLARTLNNLGTMLSELGRRQEALAAAEEALDLYRALARDNPQAFTPDLAMSLNNLGTRLGDLGRREEALAAAEEALGLFRTLARGNPQAFTPVEQSEVVTGRSL